MKAHRRILRTALELFFFVGMLVALALGALLPTPAFAATARYVDPTTGSNAGANTCANSASPCKTITYALTQSAAGDTINLAAGTYSVASNGETLPLDININLTINGSGAATTLINGANTTLVMVIGAVTVSLSNLTIENGMEVGPGGIVNNGGTLTVTNSTFAGNSAPGGNGGGIFNNGGTLTVTNSTFAGNSASGGNGGGVYTIGGTLTITNSTFSGNSASNGGGGIFINSATATLRNTIVANSPAGGNCAGTITDGGNNLQFGGTVANSCGATIPTADPKLGALANNGGPTQTMALLSGSAAIDKIANAGGCGVGITTDQRGIARPQPTGGLCDIGAYESNTQVGPNFVVNDKADTDDGSCDALVAGITDCTLREAINAANAVSTNDTITFSVSGTITLSSTLPNIVSGQGTLTIDGTGQTITISGNNAVRVMVVDSGANLTVQNVTVANGRNGGSAGGGGVDNEGGTLNITNSTFSDNIAAATSAIGGGGVYNSGTLNITNSTFSNNSAVLFRGNGGGVVNDTGGTLSATNTTFSGNSAAFGGSIYNQGTATLKNTIVANSTLGGNCYNNGGTVTADSSNMSDDNTCISATQKTFAQINLAALANNGGPTQTMALGANSAAINAANSANCPATDQRGLPRRIASTPQFCDSGAFEAQPASNTITGGTNQSAVINTPFANPLQVTVTDTNNNLLGGVVVTYTVPASGASAALSTNTATTNSSGVASVTATANGTAGGPYNVAANAAGVSPVNPSFSLTNSEANTTTTITAHTPNPSIVGQAVAVTFTVTSTAGTPTGNVTVSDGTVNCVGTVAAGTCNITFTAAGNKILTATYAGDSNFNTSASVGVAHTVNSAIIKVYLPSVLNGFVVAPDLIVQSINATVNNIQVIIKNQGNAPVDPEFWVDLYVNPNPAPTHVNQIWPLMSSQGVVWGVTASALPLNPNRTLTLTLGDPYYRPALSNLSGTLPAGTKIYVQADSANTLTTYGAVLENHEITNGAYNNITEITLSAPVTLAPVRPGTQPEQSNRLPPR